MIIKRRRGTTGAKTGYYRIQGAGNQFLHGFGDGDFIRLRDEFGREWRGVAETFDTIAPTAASISSSVLMPVEIMRGFPVSFIFRSRA